MKFSAQMLRADWLLFVWGGVIALSMMRVWSSIFFTPIYLVAMLALLSHETRIALRDLAGKLYILIVYFSWAVISLFWAPSPEISWLAIRGDILIPCIALIASFHVSRIYGDAGRFGFFLAGIWGGFLVGSILSCSYFGPEWIPKMFDSVGYYSTYVFMLAGISLPFLDKYRRPFFYLLVIGLLFLTQQRVAWVVFPVVVISDLLLHARHKIDRKKILLVLLMVFGFSFFMMKVAQSGKSADGFNPEVKANGVIEHLVKNERLNAWQQWIARGMESPLIGTGFGRDNVKAHFAQGAEWPDSLLHHGHNVLLNNFLQLGIVGMFLFVLANAQLLSVLLRQKRALATAGALIVMFFLLRNMFDDFSFKRLLIVYGLLLGVSLHEFTPKESN